MDHNEDGRKWMATLQEALADDPGEVENDALDARFIKAMLTACLAFSDDWIAEKGVQQTRKHIRHLFALHLHKTGEALLKPEGEGEEELLKNLTESCLQCRADYYNCPSPTCGNYPRFVQCMNGCTP